ncbi:sensor histidine kinase [Falsibacillus albus]|uniref:Signal transduction histidine-protein kinase ArlS n=1 Tax=Falsibacillus albus TaxID=2478915 RepID=A0A3L7JII1_9BACI|nr:HAMP domain-containing sensor histidine kinase [Falsibacillus albus]RLQ89979.1 sensor histidine kinase [Falsibacillus albus]
MKITTKINLMTTAWILIVLIIINSIVFFSFMNITFNLEQDEVHQRASDIMKEINPEDSPEVIEKKLMPYLSSHSFIRIINKQSHVIAQSANDEHLAKKIKAKYSSKSTTQRRIVREEGGEEQIIIYKQPINVNGQPVKILEIGERVIGLELGKDVLLSILAICTILGAVLSLLGGRWLSNIIIRPISNMINTMEDIEKSGIPKRISIQHETKDELTKMAVTFNRMIGRLDANLERQKQFISDASHELKTPLTVIKSYADLLRRRGIQNAEITLEAIEAIHSEATRIQRMTERFLDLANTELEHDLDLISIHLASFCEKIFNQLKIAYKREIIFHYDNDALTIMADELKLKQVIIITIDNALKYSTDRIDVYLEDHEHNAVIRVVDYGIGIPHNEIENIFERFYRVDKARSRATGGTGLGLSIAKNIMKQHHGEIKVKSTEGEGTEVELHLPKTQKTD